MRGKLHLVSLEGVEELGAQVHDRLRLLDDSGLAGLSGKDTLLTLLSGLLEGDVVSDTLLQVVLALRLANVLHTHVDSLGDDPLSVALVHNHSHGTGGDVPDDSGLSVVHLVGQRLLDGGVANDVHVLTSLVGGQVAGLVGHSLCSELLREQVTGSRTVSIGVHHCLFFFFPLVCVLPVMMMVTMR